MERDEELVKLIKVLRRTARMTMQAEWTGGSQDAAAFCVEQYNKILARLKELDPDIVKIFEPLPAGSSLTVVSMACKQVAAYYQDKVGKEEGWDRSFGFGGGAGCPPWFKFKAFRNFMGASPNEFEDLGEIIRESFQEWARRRKQKCEK